MTDTSLKHPCAGTPIFLLIVGAGRSRAIVAVVLVVSGKLLLLFSLVLPRKRCSKFCYRLRNLYIILIRCAWSKHNKPGLPCKNPSELGAF